MQALYHCLAFPTHTLVFLKRTTEDSQNSVSPFGAAETSCDGPVDPTRIGRTSVWAGVGEELRKYTWWLSDPSCVIELSPVSLGGGGCVQQPILLHFR